MRKNKTPYTLIITGIFALTIASSASAQANVREALRNRVKELSSITNPAVDEAPIVAMPLISALFERRGYEPAWNFSRKIAEKDPVEVFNQVLVTGSVETGLAAAGPQNHIYRWFQAALAQYRSILGKGGWPTVPAVREYPPSASGFGPPGISLLPLQPIGLCSTPGPVATLAGRDRFDSGGLAMLRTLACISLGALVGMGLLG